MDLEKPCNQNQLSFVVLFFQNQKTVVLDLNDAINGMVKKIDYLVKVEEVK